LTRTWSAPGQAWFEEEGGSDLKLRIATRGESPTGDDGGRHAGSESCAVVKTYTGDRGREA
jgi:hypothetical protein